MKRKFYFYVLATIIIVAVAVWHVVLISKVEFAFDVTLAANEALAQGEDPIEYDCVKLTEQFNCYDDCGLSDVLMVYSCFGKGTFYCSSGIELHFYDCDGSWLGFENYTNLIICD